MLRREGYCRDGDRESKERERGVAAEARGEWEERMKRLQERKEGFADAAPRTTRSTTGLATS